MDLVRPGFMPDCVAELLAEDGLSVVMPALGEVGEFVLVPDSDWAKAGAAMKAVAATKRAKRFIIYIPLRWLTELLIRNDALSRHIAKRVAAKDVPDVHPQMLGAPF